ncbi:MAG: hypothetical protein ACREIB_14130 [Pseudomonadota bacterium]
MSCTLDRRIEECRVRLEGASSIQEEILYRAEWYGLRVAAGHPRPPVIFTPRERARFELGLRDGETLRRVERPLDEVFR